MNNLLKDDLATDIPRRTFLGGGVIGSLGVALGLAVPAAASAPIDDPVANECIKVTASDMLASFSTLAWKLPLKLQTAVIAKEKEGVAYKSFNERYQKLRDLSKQLNINC